MEGLFFNCISLISIDLSHLFTKTVRNNFSMFYNCHSSLILQMWLIGLDNSVYAIIDWNKITNKSRAQYRLREEYRKTKLDLFDANGLADIFSRKVIACIESLLLCNVPLSHFTNSSIEYYNLYYNALEKTFSIVYELTPFKVIFNLKTIEIAIEDSDNKDLIKIGQNGILYIIINYNDPENIFIESELEGFNFEVSFEGGKANED